MKWIKAFLPRSLFARSLLILITPVILIQAITAFIFLDRHWDRVTSRLAFAVAAEVSSIADAINRNPSPENIEYLQNFIAPRLDFQMKWYKGESLKNGTALSSRSFWQEILLDSLETELAGSLNYPYSIRANDKYATARIRIEVPQGILDILVAERRLFSSTSYIFLLWMVCSSILLLVVAILFMRNQIRPIRKLAAAMQRFGKGRDIGYFRPSGAREVRQAARSFMDMQERIRRQIEQRTFMLAGVSHDLRTPITRMKIQLAMLDDNDDVRAMKDDLGDMEAMINGYLDFVRGDEAEPFSSFNAAGAIDEAAMQAGLSEGQIDNRIGAGLIVVARPMAFERCFTNIFKNAIRHGECIWVSADVIDDDGQKMVHFTVEDNGPGIPEDKYDDVLKPFYRLDNARTLEQGGTGLGLPIALDIVSSHGGTLKLSRSKEHQGLQVDIYLPL